MVSDAAGMSNGQEPWWALAFPIVSADERPDGPGDLQRDAATTRDPSSTRNTLELENRARQADPTWQGNTQERPTPHDTPTSARRRRFRHLRAQLDEASVALRSIEAVTDPALAVLPLDELLDAVLARTKDAVGGDVVAVLLLDERGEEGRVLRVRAAHGAVELAPIGSEQPIGEGVVGTAAQWARPVVAPRIEPRSDRPTPESERGIASLMAAPLVVQGNMLGMVEVGSTRHRTFDESDLRLLQLVADRCAASIERARLDEVARRNRLGAEHANLHLRILARGGTVLGKALESYDEAFNELADVIVPDFADWFSADALDPSGRLRRVAARGRTRGVLVGRAFKGVKHPHPQGEHLIRLAMAERRPQVFMRTYRLEPSDIDATIHTPSTLGSWHSDVTSMMIIPIRVQGAFWGALSFVTGPGRRGYRPSDLFTARELAERVGVAVERVVSWRNSHRAGEAAVHYAQRLQRLVEAALVVNAQLAEEEVLELLVQHAQRVLDAEAAVVVGRRVAGWSVEKSWPDLLRQTGPPAPTAGPSTGSAQPFRSPPIRTPLGQPGPMPGTDLKRMVLAAADVVARLGSVVRRPDDWPGAGTDAGTAGLEAILGSMTEETTEGDPSRQGSQRRPWSRQPPGPRAQRDQKQDRDRFWDRASPTPAAAARLGPTGAVAAATASALSSLHGRGWLGAPITGTTGDCNRVVVAVGTPGSRFSVEDESVLTLLAQMASVALQNANLYAAVHTNERRLQAVVESTPLAIAELRPSGEARWWNRAAAQMFGWGQEDGSPRIPVRPGSELVLAGLLEAARAGKPTIGVPMPAVGPDGDQIDLSVSVSPLGAVPERPRNGANQPGTAAAGPSNGAPGQPPEEAARAPASPSKGHAQFRPEKGMVTGLLIVAEDITERARLLEQFNQAERLSAMTRMAGAVAHDFNNLLTVILGCSDVIGRRLSDDDDLGQDVEAIQRAGTRAAALTGQLVRIGQHRPIQPEVVDVDEVVQNVAPMLAGVLGEDVTLELVTRASGPQHLAADADDAAVSATGEPISDDASSAAIGENGASVSGSGAGPAKPRKRRARRAKKGRILVDRSELERSILNLAINARDAMPEGGRFTVRTGLTNPRQPGGSRTVQLVFADTGTGMDPDTAAHCFEPFFTTKGRARGTGLGLSTVHATVTQAGGEVTVETEPGKGACFVLTFPAYQGDGSIPVAALSEPGEPEGVSSGGETLLVVDDETEVLRLEVRELQTGGYEVLSASNASEALHLLNSRGGAVDLLVTDVVMPGMNGIDLANAVRRRYPHVRVLFVSGHLDDDAAVNGPLPQDATLLTKPFRPEELSRSVRDSLDRALEPSPTRRTTVETR